MYPSDTWVTQYAENKTGKGYMSINSGFHCNTFSIHPLYMVKYISIGWII